MALFLLYKGETEYPNGFWWRIVDDKTHKDLSRKDLYDGKKIRLENRMGGGQDSIYYEENIVAEAKDWSELDWESVLVISESKYGYISPEGEFYGCNFHDHYELAKYVLKEENPEEYGWVKIYRSSFRDPDYYTRRKFLTEAQIKAMLDRKIEINPCDCL